MKFRRARLAMVGLLTAGAVGHFSASSVSALCHNSSAITFGNSTTRQETADSAGVCNSDGSYRGKYRSNNGQEAWVFYLGVGGSTVTYPSTTSGSYIAGWAFNDADESGQAKLCYRLNGVSLCGSSFNNYGF